MPLSISLLSRDQHCSLLNTNAIGTYVPGKEKINSVTCHKIWKKNYMIIEMLKHSYPLHTTTTNGFFPLITWLAGQCLFQFCEHSFSCLGIDLLSLLYSMICLSSTSSQAISFASSVCLVSKNCVIKDRKYIFTHACSVNFFMTLLERS